MALSEAGIQELADSIVHGSEERMVAELFARLCASMADGAIGLADEAALEQLASANAAMANGLLAEYAGAIDDETRALVESALLDASDADEASLAAVYGQEAASQAALAFAGGYSAHFAEIAAQTAAGVAEVVRRQNLAMAERAERLWYEAAGEAVTAFNQGLLPREECVARAVSRLMADGMETVDYASGVSNQLDVAVRRHVVTQASQAGGRMTLDRLEAYGHELVVTSAHYGARPSHAEWQGKPCAIHGPAEVDGVRYPGLAELTGYGTVGGLKGANCRHSINPYYPGITALPAREWPEHEARFGMSSGEYYEATQRQRELERRVRKTKREIAGMEQAGIGLESPTYVQKRLTLGRQQAALRDHCAKNGLVRQYAREKAYGVKSQPRALRKRPAVMSSSATKAANKVKAAAVATRDVSTAHGIAVRDSDVLKKQLGEKTTARLASAIDEAASSGFRPRVNAARVFASGTDSGMIRYAYSKKSDRNYFSPSRGIVVLKEGTDSIRTLVHEGVHAVDFKSAFEFGSYGLKTDASRFSSAVFTDGNGYIRSLLAEDYAEIRRLAEASGIDADEYVRRAADKAGLPDSYDGRAFLGDILDAASGGKAWIGYGHSRADSRYWAKSGGDTVGAEAVADYAGSAVGNVLEFMLIRRLFPNASASMDGLLEVMADAVEP